MKAFIRFLIRLFPWLSWDYRNRRIKPRQMCPACGAIKKHDMQFDPAQSLVVLTCGECKATWGYNPIVNTQIWFKPSEA